MSLHELSDFLDLSAKANYVLAARGMGVPNIVALLDPKGALSSTERELLAGVLEYLKEAYGDTRRRLGPLAILHPIRCAALLSQASGTPSLLDLLTALLHDKLEDLTAEGGPLTPAEVRLAELLRRLDAQHEWFLMERIEWLTRRDASETYYAYTGRLMSHSQMTPEIVRVKLADRLDNTLDMRVVLADPIERVDFFETVFQALFVPSWEGYRERGPHPPASPLNGAMRLYQLFKNTVLLSLVREVFSDREDRVSATLYDAVAFASMREAERIVLHLFAHHITDRKEQRAVITDAMAYCESGGAARIADPAGKHPLDGFFIERFDYADPKERKAAINTLYQDKALMARAAMTLVGTFEAFATDPGFRVRGLSASGCVPVV
ncbi:MAG: hypothetical protein EP329_20045 [Deltaproteobacteria bacterium]|nr:MAG: hypothetical protein EP329_20045 [Deltaproteobacteria bacterium]